MTGLTVLLIVVGLVVALFTFDLVRTHRIKRSLAAGGRAPFQGAGRRASEGVSSESLARQNGNQIEHGGGGTYGSSI